MQDIYSQGAINMQLDTTDYNSNNGGNGFCVMCGQQITPTEIT